MPRGLFGRSLIIIVAPIFLLQAIVTYVFFERDLETTTRRMARDVAADTAFSHRLGGQLPGAGEPEAAGAGRASAALRSGFEPGAKIVVPAPSPHQKHDRHRLDEVIAQQIGEERERPLPHQGLSRTYEISVEVHDGVLHMIVRATRPLRLGPGLFIAIDVSVRR